MNVTQVFEMALVSVTGTVSLRMFASCYEHVVIQANTNKDESDDSVIKCCPALVTEKLPAIPPVLHNACANNPLRNEREPLREDETKGCSSLDINPCPSLDVFAISSFLWKL